MKKCPSCKISFNIKKDSCPLCQNPLEGKCDELSFPSNVWYKTNSLILKIVLFTSLSIILLSIFLEIILAKQFKITLYISLALFTNYINIYYILKNKKNILKMFVRYGFLIILLLLLWFWLTKSTIITNYIIPSVCLIIFLFNVIVSIILRKNYFIRYSSQTLVNLILLCLPIILVILNLTTNNILAYICFFISLLTSIALLIFFAKDIIEELKKIFNL